MDLGDKKAFMLQMASVWIQEEGPIENLSAWMVVRDDSPTPKANISIPIFPSARVHADGSGIFVGTVQGRFQYKLVRSYAFRFNGRQTQGHCPSLPKHGVMPINKLGALTDPVNPICQDRTARYHVTGPLTRPGRGGQVNTEMTDLPPLLHKTWLIELRSYRRKIGWIPKVTVKRSEGNGTEHTIAGNPKDLLPTQRLRIRWLKSWPLNGLIPSSLH